MRRREFITLLGGAAAVWPLAARAQQTAMPVVGFLNGGTSEGYASLAAAFRRGLRESGYSEGGNVAIEFRWAEGRNDQLPMLASDLVERRVDVIAAGGIAAALAAKAATRTIPIVFAVGVDPVEIGLVASLNQPGGNLTGVSSLAVELGPKLLELVHEGVPTARAVALLTNPANPNAATLSKEFTAAASSLGLELQTVHASSVPELEASVAALARSGTRALVIGTDVLFNSHMQMLAALTRQHRIPTIYRNREFAAAGGLMSYGASFTESYRLVGRYIARILRGEKPADLPVQQATKLELVINLKTAKALGLEIPPTLLAIADEVIE